MQVHLPNGTKDGYKISFNPEEELTIAQVRPMIADHYNFQSCTMFFCGKKIEDDELVRDVARLTSGKVAQIHVVIKQEAQ